MRIELSTTEDEGEGGNVWTIYATPFILPPLGGPPRICTGGSGPPARHDATACHAVHVRRVHLPPTFNHGGGEGGDQ